MEEIMAAAKASGDARLMMLASRELRPCIEAFVKMDERAKAGDDALQRRWMEFLAQLPDDFVKRVRDGDQRALAAIENAVTPPD